jgi:hypothetical protein
MVNTGGGSNNLCQAPGQNVANSPGPLESSIGEVTKLTAFPTVFAVPGPLAGLLGDVSTGSFTGLLPGDLKPLEDLGDVGSVFGGKGPAVGFFPSSSTRKSGLLATNSYKFNPYFSPIGSLFTHRCHCEENGSVLDIVISASAPF